VAEYVYGPLPFFSNLSSHNVMNVTAAAVGSAAICCALDPVSQEMLALMIKRGETGENGEDRFGITGGFTNLDFTKASTYVTASVLGEQPAQGAVRELREEILDDAGRPILDIDPARLRVISTGVDYRAVGKGGLPVQYNGHVVILSSEELELVQKHIARLHADPAYREAARIKSEGEVSDVILMRLSDAAQMDPIQFTHPHELDALRYLNTNFGESRLYPPTKSPQVKYAEYFARKKHGAKTRKGAAGEPAFTHLADVASILSNCTDGKDETLVIAGLLHDTLEDTDTTYEGLVGEFGQEVADIVRKVSDDLSLPKEERKRLQIETAPHKSNRAKMLKIADKISNLRAVITSPPEHWNLERKCEYFEWSRRIVDGCRGVNAALDKLFDETYQQGVAALAAPEEVWAECRRNPFRQSAKDGMAP